MPHCTNNFAWYLSKFIAGFTGMLFFYVIFLKEREYSCLCRPRMREYLRRKGENTNSCSIDDQADANARREHGTKSMFAGVKSVWTWCTKIRKWLLENDPVILSETALVLGRGLPKNDNGNFDFPSKSLLIVEKLCVLCNVAQRKNQESTSNVRRKRQAGHCIFRHCSGLVCAQKLLRRRKNKQHCVCLRISQDAITDYWKLHDKSMHDGKDSGEKTILQPCHCEEKIDSNECSGNVETKEEQTKNIDCVNENAFLVTHCKREDSELNITLTFPSTSTARPCNDHNVRQLLPGSTDTKCKQMKDVKHTNTLKSVCNDSRKLSPKAINENVSNIVRRSNSLSNVNSSRKSSDKRRSQSETSFSETLAADNCVNSILYRELQKNCGPSVKTKLSKDRMQVQRNIKSKLSLNSNIENEKNFIPRQKFDADQTVDYFLNDVQKFSPSQCHKYNTKQPLNKYRSATRLQKGISNNTAALQKNFTPLNWHTNAVYQRRQPKVLCKNCCHHSKVQDRNELQWDCPEKQSLPVSQYYFSPQTQYRMPRKNLQSQKTSYPCECFKSQKQLDVTSSHNFCFVQKTLSKHRSQMPQSKEKRTFVIFRNRKPNKLYSTTNSPNSTSSTSTGAVKRSAYDNQMNHRCSHIKSYCTRPMTGPCKYNKCNTIIDSTSLLSPSSSLSSSRQCRSWTVLSQNSVYRKQEPISSSSCVNVQRWRRMYGRNENQTTAYLSSTSSSCSLSSLSTFREDYSLEDTDKDLKQIQRAWRRPRYRDQKRKRILYTDEHRVRWNIKDTY